MDVGTIRGFITVITMATFLAICWWAYRSGNRGRFEEDGRIPFADEAKGESKRARGASGREGADD